MEAKLTTAHRLTLWRLAAGGGIEWAKSIVPKLTPAVRSKLVGMGLVEVHRERDPVSKRPSLKLELTDAGWEWTTANMELGNLEGSPGTGELLQLIMAALNERFVYAGLTPEDVFRFSSEEEAGAGEEEVAEESGEKTARPVEKRAAPAVGQVFFEPESTGEEGRARRARERRFEARMPAPIVDAAIMRGYLDTTRGYIEVPALIGEIRARVHLEQREFDAALERMQRQGKIQIDDLNGEGDEASVTFLE